MLLLTLQPFEMGRSQKKSRKGDKEEGICAHCKDGGADKEKWIECDFCNLWYHVRCQPESINKDMYNLLLDYNVIKDKAGDIAQHLSVQWKCEICASSSTEPKKEDMVGEFAKINHKLDDLKKIVSVKQIQYSEVVKTVAPTNQQKRDFFPRLGLKPKKVLSKSEANIELKKVILKTAAKINKAVIAEDGSMKIDCFNQANLQLIEEGVADSFVVTPPKLLCPRIRMFNLSEDNHMTDLEMADAIKKQNCLHEDANVVIIKRFKNRLGNSSSCIIELDPLSHRQLADKKIFVGFQRLLFDDYISIRRCGNCLAFSHGTKECNKTEKRCSNCSSVGHLREHCDKEKHCFNCAEKCTKMGFDIDTKHSLMDKNCFCYKMIVNSVKRRIQRFDDE